MSRFGAASLLSGLLVAGLAGPATPALGQDAVRPEERMAGAAGPPIVLTPAQEARARAIESELKCPVCRSQSIRQSRSFMAEDMKRRVRELVAEGWSDEEIRQYFIDRYDEWILLTPPKRGFSLTAYALPLLAVGLGVVVLLAFARGRKRDTEIDSGPPEAPAASRYLSALEKEIEETQ